MKQSNKSKLCTGERLSMRVFINVIELDYFFHCGSRGEGIFDFNMSSTSYSFVFNVTHNRL